MDAQEIARVLKKIRMAVYHVGTFEGSYPRILKGAPIYTRSHLIVLYEVLPHLERLLKFTSDTIPVITKILGLATEGKSDLEKASEYLRTINQSSETAVTEIFAALDRVGALLVEAQKAEAADDGLKQTLNEANVQLMSIVNALQFQDITAQKIEATNVLLAKLGDGLIELIRELGLGADPHNIQVREGTYDPDAAFDRDTADTKQGEIDNLVATDLVQKEPVQSKPSKTAPEPSPEKPDDIENLSASVRNGNGSVKADDTPVEQDDIDDLIASTQNETENSAEAEVDQDDIDDIVASTQNKAEDTAEVGQGDIDDLGASAQEDLETIEVDQDDIDDLVASAQETETQEDVSQNDIDDLGASAQPEDPEEESDLVSQDDIDSLVASAQDGNASTDTEGDAPSEVSQDDIDALLGDK